MAMYPALSRRERQIMEAIYRRGSATVSEVRGDLPDPPSYSAVRATLRILEEKGVRYAVLPVGGFGARVWRQTLSGIPEEMTGPEPARSGFGEGAFVAVRAERLDRR